MKEFVVAGNIKRAAVRFFVGITLFCWPSVLLGIISSRMNFGTHASSARTMVLQTPS